MATTIEKVKKLTAQREALLAKIAKGNGTATMNAEAERLLEELSSLTGLPVHLIDPKRANG